MIVQMRQQREQDLIAILQLAHAGELAAAYAYRGHWHSAKSAQEKTRIQQIENEEWHHRLLVGEMLATLDARQSNARAIRAAIVGRLLGLLCHFSGWLAPMYGAGSLESRNIREYENAARCARDCGRGEFVECLLTMAEVEWEHEFYFRSRVEQHRWGRKLRLWPKPPRKETIRESFAKELPTAGISAAAIAGSDPAAPLLMQNVRSAIPIVLFGGLLFCWPGAPTATTRGPNNTQGGAQTSASASGQLRYKVPQGWVIEEPASKMRAAQYHLPKIAGDGEDASLVLYYFGPEQGGSVSANVDRWINQMQQPDGRPSRDRAKTETLTVNGLKVTMVDVSGTYTAQMSPGSEARHNDAKYRLLAAVVETPKGNYFAKLIGPEKTVSSWGQSFSEYLKSFEFK